MSKRGAVFGIILLLVIGYGAIRFIPSQGNVQNPPPAFPNDNDPLLNAISGYPRATNSGASDSTPSAGTFFGATGANSTPITIITLSEMRTEDPTIHNDSVSITYSPDYSILANYTLGLINSDRLHGMENRTINGMVSKSQSETPLSFSKVPSGQQHADSMAYFGYFGHWDTQGYKPYMRYTMLGGTGAVDENTAFGNCMDSTFSHSEPCNTQTAENAITAMETSMMKNDSVCCNNGHRDNILDPSHDKVSIGISYTGSVVYLVEDFENSFLNVTKFSYSSGVVTLQGLTDSAASLSNAGNATISVYYDATPQPLSVGYDGAVPQLEPACFGQSCTGYPACGPQSQVHETSSCKYWGTSDPGTLLGGVFPPCPSGYACPAETTDGHLAMRATAWQSSNDLTLIQFPLASFVQNYGDGVYTLYLFNDSGELWTSLSIFMESSQPG